MTIPSSRSLEDIYRMIATARSSGMPAVTISTEWLASMVNFCERLINESDGAQSEVIRLLGELEALTNGLRDAEAMLEAAVVARDAALARIEIARSHLEAWAALTPRATQRRSIDADLADLV